MPSAEAQAVERQHPRFLILPDQAHNLSDGVAPLGGDSAVLPIVASTAARIAIDLPKPRRGVFSSAAS